MGNHIFISYKSEQREYAMTIHDALKRWGLDPWLDVKRLQPGGEWANEIDEAIKTCQALLGIVTPVSMASRYVTNEWDLAIMMGKLFIPLLFEATEPHYKYIDIQRIDFSREEKAKSFGLLRKRLTASDLAVTVSKDPYSEYLQQLYDRINKYLEQKLITSLRHEDKPEPVHLQLQTADNVANYLARKEQIDPLFVAAGIQDKIQDQPSQVFEDFGRAFSSLNGRVLLLGEPGAGKTITLLQHARDLIVLRRQNPSAPVPILGMIYTWEASNWKAIPEWLANSYGTPANTAQLIEAGEAVLLLDGLDELGNRRPANSADPSGPTFDPRQRFLKSLPANNQIVVTCRTQDFLSVDEKAPVNGVVTLRPLGDVQIRQYLQKQPELLAFIESDTDLKNWLSTPLLLSFFAFSYEGMDSQYKEKLKQLKTAHELREFIFNEYIHQRFLHEERKASIRKEQLPHSLDQVLSYLGNLALNGVVVFWEYDIETFPESMRPIIPASQYKEYIQKSGLDTWDGLRETAAITPITFKESSLIDFATKLNFLISTEEEYRFAHLLLRNHIGYLEALKRLEKLRPAIQEATSGISYKDNSGQIEVFEDKCFAIIEAIVALRVLNDPRAIPSIQPYLAANGGIMFGYHEAANIPSEAEYAIRVLQSVSETDDSSTN